MNNLNPKKYGIINILLPLILLINKVIIYLLIDPAIIKLQQDIELNLNIFLFLICYAIILLIDTAICFSVLNSSIYIIAKNIKNKDKETKLGIKLLFFSIIEIIGIVTYIILTSQKI